MKIRKLLRKVVAIVVVVLFLGVATLVGLVRWEHTSDLTLPKPTGHFSVSRTNFFWTDDALTDDLAPTPGTKRSVFVWMWYPSTIAPNAPPAEYLPTAWRTAQQGATGPLMREFLNHDLSKVHTNSTTDAPVSAEQASYPVVIMRSGGGALTTDFTTLAEDLASNGYIVVGFDVPYRTTVFVFPDGHVVKRVGANNPETMSYESAKELANTLLPMWTSDTAFIVDQLQRLNGLDPSGRFTGKINLDKLGIFGHSFGGATALQFCHNDNRCKAGIDIDGMPFGSVIPEGAGQPFLLLFSDHSGEDSAEGREVTADINSVYDHLKSSKYIVTIRGANHFTFSDQIIVKSSYFVRPFLLINGGRSAPSAERGLTITRAYIRTFFDVYLKNAPAGALESLRESFPEVSPGLAIGKR